MNKEIDSKEYSGLRTSSLRQIPRWLVMALLLVVVVVLIVVSLLWWKQRRELKQTMTWLENTLKANANASYMKEDRESNFVSVNRFGFVPTAFNGCDIEWRQSETASIIYSSGSKSDPLVKQFSVKVSLSALSSSRVNVKRRPEDLGDVWDVELNGANSAPVIQILGGSFGKEGIPVGKSPFVAIPFTDEQIAKRVSNAFSHAITLCGGKPDLF